MRVYYSQAFHGDWVKAESKHCFFAMFSTNLNRKQSARYLQHRSTAKIVWEEFNVDGGWHEDEAQIRTLGHQRTQYAK